MSIRKSVMSKLGLASNGTSESKPVASESRSVSSRLGSAIAGALDSRINHTQQLKKEIRLQTSDRKRSTVKLDQLLRKDFNANSKSLAALAGKLDNRKVIPELLDRGADAQTLFDNGATIDDIARSAKGRAFLETRVSESFLKQRTGGRYSGSDAQRARAGGQSGQKADPAKLPTTSTRQSSSNGDVSAGLIRDAHIAQQYLANSSGPATVVSRSSAPDAHPSQIGEATRRKADVAQTPIELTSSSFATGDAFDNLMQDALVAEQFLRNHAETQQRAEPAASHVASALPAIGGRHVSTQLSSIPESPHSAPATPRHSSFPLPTWLPAKVDSPLQGAVDRPDSPSSDYGLAASSRPASYFQRVGSTGYRPISRIDRPFSSFSTISDWQSEVQHALSPDPSRTGPSASDYKQTAPLSPSSFYSRPAGSPDDRPVSPLGRPLSLISHFSLVSEAQEEGDPLTLFGRSVPRPKSPVEADWQSKLDLFGKRVTTGAHANEASSTSSSGGISSTSVQSPMTSNSSVDASAPSSRDSRPGSDANAIEAIQSARLFGSFSRSPSIEAKTHDRFPSFTSATSSFGNKIDAEIESQLEAMGHRTEAGNGTERNSIDRSIANEVNVSRFSWSTASSNPSTTPDFGPEDPSHPPYRKPAQRSVDDVLGIPQDFEQAEPRPSAPLAYAPSKPAEMSGPASPTFAASYFSSLQDARPAAPSLRSQGPTGNDSTSNALRSWKMR